MRTAWFAVGDAALWLGQQLIVFAEWCYSRVYGKGWMERRRS